MIESVIDIDADLADWIEQRQTVPSADEDYPHQGISQTWSADLVAH
ncbi:hypothetical protein [Mycobacterium sp.]